MDSPPIQFRPVTLADLTMLGEWMERPHWREWWGDPSEELGYVREMIEGRDSTRPFLILLGGEPAGYIQVWRMADAMVEPWLTEAPWLYQMPEGAVGVDLSLAEAQNLNRGIGTAVLKRFVAMLRDEGCKEIWIDPDPENIRAVRAYEKAGFRPVPGIADATGACLLMRHHKV